MTPDERIQQIRERCDKATPEPWEVRQEIVGNPTKTVIHHNYKLIARSKSQFGRDHVHSSEWEPNAEFIAHSREDIPWLLDQLTAANQRAETAERIVSQVDEVLCVNWITVKDDDYEKALADLVAAEIQIHDDPQVSEVAAKRQAHLAAAESARDAALRWVVELAAERDRLREALQKVVDAHQAALDELKALGLLDTVISAQTSKVMNFCKAALAETPAAFLNLLAERNCLREALNKIHSWLVCYAMTTPEDMAQSFEHMEKVADEALAGMPAPTPELPLVRCHCCGGTVIYKHQDGEIVFFHDCCAKYGKPAPATFGDGCSDVIALLNAADHALSKGSIEDAQWLVKNALEAIRAMPVKEGL